MRKCFSPKVLLKLSVIILGLIAITSLLLYYLGINPSPYLDYSEVSLSIIGLFLSWNKIFSALFNKQKATTPKGICRFLKKEDCPYTDMSDCPYDTDYCCAHKKKDIKKWKRSLLSFLFSFCSLFLLINVIRPFNETSQLIDLLKGLSIAFVTAYATAFLIDVPTRLKEHQEHYVSLLTSNEYLKTLSEKELSKLREQIIWLQRMKDLPNMPEGLMKRDNSISGLLNNPFFRQYSQIVEIEKETCNMEPSNGNHSYTMIRKKVHIDGSGFNPYPIEREIKIDLGLSFSLCFDESRYEDDDAFIAQAKELFKLKSFKVFVDGSEKAYDMLMNIEVRLKRKKRDGFNYNAYLSLVNIESEEDGLRINPKAAPESSDLSFRVETSPDPVKLYVYFCDKVRFSIDYEIVVPISDTCFTKRLRYPVKYLHIDYSLGKGMNDYCVVGQLIGTMIDQTDITTYNTDNDNTSRIVIDTHSWLLPKNGAVIVHQKRDN